MLGFLHAKKTKRITNAAIAGLFVALQLPMAVLFSPVASADNPHTDTNKVTICHRSDSVTNPYQQISVDFDSTTGALKDNGQGDHTDHTGPVATSQTVAQNLKDNKLNWGDIIPPYTWDGGGSYAGLNWTTDGQAVYRNDCAYVTSKVTPAAVTFTDLCGTANDVYTIPTTTGVDYQVGGQTVSTGDHNATGSVTVDAVAQSGYSLDGTTEWSNTFTDLPCSQNVTPAAVTFNDSCGNDNDTYTIPSTTGVDYQVNGKTVDAGTYDGNGNVTVTAVAQTGYTLSGDTEWTHHFTNESCPKVTICHRSDSVTNPYQQISVDFDAATGALKDNGQGDHTTHTGPVATSESVAQALKDAHNNWGDIIPPYTWDGGGSYAGLNWTTDGQAVYNNDCNYVTQEFSGSISGSKFSDLNNNGVWNENEPGLSGWTIFIDTNGNGALDSGEQSITTGNDGSYSFTGLAEGDYTVCEVMQTGWTQTFPGTENGCYSISLPADTEDGNFTGADFGNHKSGEVLGSSVGSIAGFKFNDLNGNGKWDSGEPGLSGWTIFLDKNSNGTLDSGEVSTVTASNGSYSFADLDEGNYRVCEVQQTGWTQKLGGSDSGCYDITVNANGTLDWANINFGNAQFLPGRGGQVLGASTLVDTGTPTLLIDLFAAMAVLGTVAALAQATRKQNGTQKA